MKQKKITLTGKLRNRFLFIITHQENLEELAVFKNEMNSVFD